MSRPKSDSNCTSFEMTSDCEPSMDCLGDYRPATPIIIECLERLVLPALNVSTEGTIPTTLHMVLERTGSCVRMLCIDHSLAFNTIIPDILMEKLSDLGLSSRICSWVKVFLPSHLHTVKLGPQHWPYSPCTHDRRPAYPTHTIIKFVDDTT